MPKKHLKDPEITYFTKYIVQHQAGVRYQKSWIEVLYSLKRLNAATRRGDELEVAIARAEYIEASDECTKRLQVIEQQFGWPHSDF